MVGKIVKAELRAYWTAAPDPEIDALEAASWVEALQDWSIDEIRAAFANWIASNPSKRCNHGHISALLKAARGEAWAARNVSRPEPARDEPCSKDAAAEIMRQAGFTPRGFG